MKILSDSDHDIALAAAALAGGRLVAFPTETVYGLGGDAFNTSALARIFEAKNRPRFDPLIIHIAALSDLDRLVLWEALKPPAHKILETLAGRFWPGPLTLILPKRPEVPDLATSGLSNAAVRFPAHPAAQNLIRLSSCAVAAPSANPFGRLSPTRAEHVAAQLGDRVDFIIDGGRASVGVESTVVDISSVPVRILRPGGISREQIEALIGPVDCFEKFGGKSLLSANSGAEESPGQMKSHYAPRTPLVLCRWGELASLPESPGEGRLYFSAPERPGRAEGPARTLSPSGNPVEAAANLFDMLHELDVLGLRQIRAEEAPPEGLGAAINDRLRRAAAAF